MCVFWVVVTDFPALSHIIDFFSYCLSRSNFDPLRVSVTQATGVFLMDVAAFKETLFEIRAHGRSRWVLITAAGRQSMRWCRREAEPATVRLFVALLHYVCRVG